MEIVELRSDTFTTPTPEMRRAMAEAEVGDDVWGEDPTAIALQEHCAAIFGKQAALFVPSGTMGNEASLKVLTRPGDEVIAEAKAHLILYERGAPGLISGVVIRTVDAPDGQMNPADVAALIQLPSDHTAHTGLVWIENTHNYRGGKVVPLENVRAIARIARDAGIPVFMDGARIFNASTAAGVPVRDYAAEVDALSFCFSKGLSAPVGSMVVGSAEFIAELRHVRGILGGGMRQVGVLCAAARVAIDCMVDRLVEDHENARRLAEGFAEALPGSVNPASVETNMVFVDVRPHDLEAVVASMRDDGVFVAGARPGVFRAVTHKDVTRAGVDRAVAVFARAIAS